MAECGAFWCPFWVLSRLSTIPIFTNDPVFTYGGCVGGCVQEDQADSVFDADTYAK